MARESVRLTIPFWGLTYCDKVLKTTLPALLAPGNLPALAEDFDVEISLVTETRLFHIVEGTPIFVRLQRYATVRLVSLDDLLTGVAGDYGPVLTFALFLGFKDLGPRMCDTWLMFLNSDFVLADGSYRTAARLMKEGHRVIHSPSFRVVSENVMPVLTSRIDPETGVLAVPTRDMTRIALDHRHITVRARTVNQKLFHVWRMDQFYWYVDDNTLIGHQCPIALVAIKPEREVTTPKLMFDYGVIPELCPTAKKYYIEDSDAFFLLEPQSRMTGQDMIRLGWIDQQAIADDLSKWTTAEQRDCLRQVHIFHGADLPDGMESHIAEAERYIADLLSRLPPPKPHDDHPLFRVWWASVVERIQTGKHTQAPELKKGPDFRLLRSLYNVAFGGISAPRITHPLWVDLCDLIETVRRARSKSQQVLWILAERTTLVGIAENGEACLPRSEFTIDTAESLVLPDTEYDLCVVEVPRYEIENFRKIYTFARRLTRHGGKVVLWVDNRMGPPVAVDDLAFCDQAFPTTDTAEVAFQGNRWTRWLSAISNRANMSLFDLPKLRIVLIAATLLGLAPLCVVANALAKTRRAKYTPHWSSLLASFKVSKPSPPERL